MALRPDKINLALEYGRRANEVAPNVPKFQSDLAFVFYQQQKYGEAQQWLQKAMNNGGADDPDILERLGDVYFKMGDVDQAVQQWQKAADRKPYAALLRKKIQNRKLID